MSGAAQYVAPGPVAEAFLEGQEQFAALMGPIGSGKTTAGLWRGVKVALWQKPGPDGIRRVKGAVIRSKYVDLWRTTIPSWRSWFPENVGKFTGGRDGPAEHVLTLRHPDGGLVELTVLFLALGDLVIEEALRGLEVTWAYVDELDLLGSAGFGFLFSRTGRYPSKRMGGATWRGVWGTLNAPDIDNWVHTDFVDPATAKPGYRLFRQPGGLAPGAENLPNLPDGYYRDNARGMKDWEIRRFIHAQFGYSRDGKPVFPEFNDLLHVSPTRLTAHAGARLVVGLDAGGTPAGVISQRMPDGQRRLLAELVTPADGVTGANRFGTMLRTLLDERFPGLAAYGVADPSAAYGADREAGEASWIETVSRVAGIAVQPAPTNALLPRLEAVRVPLTRLIDGRAPALLIDPGCRQIVRGLASEYRYRRIAGPSGRFAEQPDKNGASHVMDAVQYACLDGGGYHEALGRSAIRATQMHVADTGFQP